MAPIALILGSTLPSTVVIRLVKTRGHRSYRENVHGFIGTGISDWVIEPKEVAALNCQVEARFSVAENASD